MKDLDYCQLFKDIEADPLAVVQLTIGQYYGAAEHVKTCQDCRDRAERVVESAPPTEPGIDISQN